MDLKTENIKSAQEIGLEENSAPSDNSEESIISDELSLILEDDEIVSPERRYDQSSVAAEDPEWFNEFVTPQSKDEASPSLRTNSTESASARQGKHASNHHYLLIAGGILLCLVLFFIGLYQQAGRKSEGTSISLPLTIPFENPTPVPDIRPASQVSEGLVGKKTENTLIKSTEPLSGKGGTSAAVRSDESTLTSKPPFKDTSSHSLADPVHSQSQFKDREITTKSKPNIQIKQIEPGVKNSTPEKQKIRNRTQQKTTAEASEKTKLSSAPSNTIEIFSSKKIGDTYHQLKVAYITYLNGDYDQSRKIYSVVLNQKPQNRDALLGVAAIATKQGRLSEARRVYHYLLELNPKDDFAQMSLMGIQGIQDPVARISQLKEMLRRQPDSPQLHFTMGNFYSALSRWSDAQRSFFQAFRLDNHNPNYAYNLAVSLDRLGKGKAALNYYQRALQLADNHTVNFVSSEVEMRLQQLRN